MARLFFLRCKQEFLLSCRTLKSNSERKRLMRRTIMVLALTGVLAWNMSAQANHATTTSSGKILIGGLPSSFCGTDLPPGYSVHQQDPKLSEQCFTKPPGATGATITYSPTHPQSDLGCDNWETWGNKIRVYGYGFNAYPPLLPTVAQSFTVTWTHTSPSTCLTQQV